MHYISNKTDLQIIQPTEFVSIRPVPEALKSHTSQILTLNLYLKFTLNTYL